MKPQIQKAKLESLGNDGYLFRYGFKKGELNAKVFLAFMNELGFKQDKVTQEFFTRYLPINDEKDIPGEHKHVDDFVEDKERVFELRNDDFDVEIICFPKEDYLRIRTRKKSKILRLADKFFKFEKEK